MNFRRSLFSIKDKNVMDIDDREDYPTIADLIREQKVSNNDAKSVHHRRDLDSLG